MKAKASAIAGTERPPQADAFSLYDNEEAILARTDSMLSVLAGVAGGVTELAEAYRRSYREQRRLVRMSDRMQLDLQKANLCLAEQRRDLQTLNEALSGEIEHRSRLEAELRRRADTDALTGALSRRRFMEIAGREWLRHQRMGLPACVLMLDLDRFKRLNDGHGHATGDAALIAFVEACRATLRALDVIGRMGGEEFAILLPECALDAGLVVAERVRLAVAGTPVPAPTGPVSMSVSIGIVETGERDTVEDALKRADAALYAAKHAGRNRVRSAAEDPAEQDLSAFEPAA